MARSAGLNERCASCADIHPSLPGFLLAKKPAKLVAVAVANKMARIAWAIMAKGGYYRAPELAAAA